VQKEALIGITKNIEKFLLVKNPPSLFAVVVYGRPRCGMATKVCSQNPRRKKKKKKIPVARGGVKHRARRSNPGPAMRMNCSLMVTTKLLLAVLEKTTA